jgi:kumamolisin
MREEEESAMAQDGETLNTDRAPTAVAVFSSGSVVLLGRRLATVIAVSVLVGVSVIAALHLSAPPRGNRQGFAASSNSRAMIGPTHEKSVSFLVLLHSAAPPTCLKRWSGSAGLSVRWTRGQRWASISGAPRNVDRSFDVTINDYRSSDGSVVFAANHAATVPTGVCGEVAGVGTIHSFIEPASFDVPKGGLSSTDLLTAYDALPLAQSGDSGQGQTVVFMETGGFLQSDFNKFVQDEKLSPMSVTLMGKNGGFNPETTMDIETVHEIAPQAHLVFFNLNSISKATSAADVFGQAFLQAEQKFPGSIMSLSLGICETNTSAFNKSDLVALNSTVASIEAKGSTVFASSGDSGGLDCTPNADAGQVPKSSFEGVSVPASLPAVTGTGGTALTTDASGNYIGETTWSEPFLSQGTGGGVSVMFPRPSWQTGVGTGGQVDANGGREVPDVSSDSDPATGNFIIENGKAEVGGGTSLAAPSWAGFTALMDEDLATHHDSPVGFFNPILYQLANSSVPYPPFHDITVGGNDFFSATPGYDMTTGLGSPDVYNLARDLLAGKD